MNRDAMIAKVRALKDRFIRKGIKPTVLAVSSIDMVKLGCTHLHGLHLTKLRGLKRGQLMFLAPDAEGKLQAVKL